MKCPECGAEMTIRKNSKNESEFYGCTEYPTCKHTEEVPAAEYMRRAGVAQLPGFE